MSENSQPSSPVVPPLQDVDDDVRQVLEHLEHASSAFREKAAKSRQEVDAFDAQMDAIRMQFLFRNVAPRLQQQVFLCMPRSGDVAFEAAQAAFMSCKPGSPFGVIVTDKLTSCTPSSFNHGWCDALNARNGKDEPVFDWFCLLHADVYPHAADHQNDPRSWLQIMIEEAEKGGYDALHAAVGIKDNRGLTSTAIGLRAWEHQWERVRRITTTELQKMPETFDWRDALDVMGTDGWDDLYGRLGEGMSKKLRTSILQEATCMLPNTGCLLVRLHEETKRFPGFRFQNRVSGFKNGRTYSTESDEWDWGGPVIPQFVPEDWDFGRWCANRNLRVGCTRAVVVEHVGRGVFTSGSAWGSHARDDSFFALAEASK